MSAVSETQQRKRRLRSEARRSITAILDAAVAVLSERPDASIEDVAAAASVSRQTVYAHYPSREALVNAAIDRGAEEAMAAIDAADLDRGPAPEALIRLLDAAWRTFQRYPLLLRMAPADPDADRERHQPVLAQLDRLIRRGQEAGEFTTLFSRTWLATVTVALGHAAGEQVAAGQMTPNEATTALHRSLLCLLGSEKHSG